MTTITDLAIWDASQSRMVQRYAWKLWRNVDGVENGVQEAILRAITRKGWFDATKGKLETWLMLTLKSVRQAERSKGHRRGTVAEPRVMYPGDDAMPTLTDLCDPESILIAREINLDAVEPQRARHSGAKLTDDQVLAIRASDTPNRKLAAQYGVGRSIISDVKLRRTYKNVRETANVLHPR